MPDVKVSGEDRSRSYPLPSNEAERLKDVVALGLLDSMPEPEFDRITRLARILFGTRSASLSLVDDDRVYFKSTSGLNVSELPRQGSFSAHTIVTDSQLVVLNTEQDDRFADNPLVKRSPKVRFYAGTPVTTPSGSRVGTLSIYDNEPRKQWSPVEAGLLGDLSELVSAELKYRLERKQYQSLLLELEKLKKKFGTDVQLDPLTGLADKRYLETAIKIAKDYADSEDRFLAFLYVEVHNISEINEEHGDAAGDSLLKEMADRLKAIIRGNDLALRIGGDQFLTLLPGLQLTSGVERPVRALLQSALEPVPFGEDKLLKIELSLGISYYPHSGSNSVQLIKEARAAMLSAKEAGCNCCAVSIKGKPQTFIHLNKS